MFPRKIKISKPIFTILLFVIFVVSPYYLASNENFFTIKKVEKAEAAVETRYLRSDQQTVNSLTAYILGIAQSATGLSTNVTETGSGGATVLWGIRVWKRTSAGVETEITAGTPVAQVSRAATGTGLQSTVWTPSATVLSPTDSIVVRAYIKVGALAWQQGATIPDFTTEQIGAIQLDAVQWTVTYYTSYATVNTGAPGGRYTRGFLYWGNSTYNSNLQYFSWTSANVAVSSIGAQTANMIIPSTNQYVGGAFVITEVASSRSVTGITITENGTVDALNNLDNIKLYYDLDTSAPYDCASETYVGGETQFGATDTDGFSGADGTSAFSGTATITTTQTMCVYVVLDVGNGATDAETIEIEITNPSTQVVVTGGAGVNPATPILLSGSTILQDDNLTQIHYHWRNDDGLESTATSATGGVEDTVLSILSPGAFKRLRIEVSNEGTAISASTQYRLEYGTKSTICGDIVTWTDVGAVGGDWDMYDTTNLTDGNNTTNIAVAIGGTTNENTTFKTPNLAVKDTSSQVTGITLASTEYMEIEYSVRASISAPEGTTYCFRVSDTGTAIKSYSKYPEVTLSSDVTVGALGVQTVNMTIPSTNQYVGGSFVIVENNASRSVTGITIAENGTVDALNNLDNIKLYYDLDTSAPYDCASETYVGGEAQFGVTDTDGFSGANGTSTFSGTATITTTQAMCVYVVLDVGNGAVDTETIEIEISDPSTQVVVSGGGTVAPSSVIAIPGGTVLESANLVQIHYHWRNDDGSESSATSATDGIEDTALANVVKNTNKRLRVEVSNEGSFSSSPVQYRLEYGQKVTTCDAVGVWVDVGDVGGDWDISDSLNLTDGSNTTNIAVATGGTTNENTTFKTPNLAVKDTSSQTASITLTSTEYMEAEYSIEATDNAGYGNSYCFRLTDIGTAIKTYTVYPEATTRANKDFFVQRGVITMSGSSATITAGVNYIAPATSTNAFIRITNTQHTGAGHDVGGGAQNSDDVTTYISDPSNIESSVTFTRDGVVGTTRISWEIVEYIGPTGGDNEIIVRSQQAVTFDSALTTANVSVSGVSDGDDVVVFVTGQQNPDRFTTEYNTGLVTANWNDVSGQAEFTRDEASGNAINVSYAVVEFIGSNWKIQRVEHTYTQAVSIETETITTVNSLDRTFIHTQKRVGTAEAGIDEFGHEVWLSSVGAISFRLQNTVTTPSLHTAVVWVIENTQTNGTPVYVTRSSGTISGGLEPGTFNISIGKTLSDITTASIFTNNRVSGTDTSFPRPIMSARIISDSLYELWISDTGQIDTYRTEVVEWPTAVRVVGQNYYRFYVNNDAVDPTDPWPAGATDLGENTSITGVDSPPLSGDVLRVRMTISVGGSNLSASSSAFKLQYGQQVTTCSAISDWYNIGEIGSTTALWRGYNNATPADGVSLSTNPPTAGDLNISISDRAGSYEEENISSGNPYKIYLGEDAEYDWVVEDNNAPDLSAYCFRMINYDNSSLDYYNNYPTVLTAGYLPESKNWRWYDDENNETPTVPMSAENVAPSSVVSNNIMKLRVTARETAGKAGENIKFKLQFSESSTFSSGVYDVKDTASCVSQDLWCFADGAGSEDVKITTGVLTDSDSCVGGVGNGCGTHNEYSYSASPTYDFPLYANAEFEFTIKNVGARPNAVYFFRMYDLSTNSAVPSGSGESYPSLSAEGATLTFTINGVASSVTTEGIITDVATTPTSVPFGILPFGSSVKAAQKITVTTNATSGYRVYAYQRQGLIRSGNIEINPVTGTNAVPLGWATGCDTVSVSGCYGYHTGDDLLYGASTRFAADDSYAQFSGSSEEMIYSPGPVTNESTDIIYRTEIMNQQEAGKYSSSMVYIIVPSF